MAINLNSFRKTETGIFDWRVIFYKKILDKPEKKSVIIFRKGRERIEILENSSLHDSIKKLSLNLILNRFCFLKQLE